MEWILTTLTWYIYVFLLGIVAFPMTKKIFAPFFDKGYPFAKTISILLLSYVMFVLGVCRIAAFTQAALFGIIVFFIVISLYLKYWKQKKTLHFPKINKGFFILLFEELLFVASLFFLTYVREQEPSIRGLEKFMDYGFMNSILRSRYFPPIDMWLSGGNPINYYYFGHMTGAVLIKLTGIVPAVGYNLILATIFAQATTLTFSLVGNIIYLFHKSLKYVLFGGIVGSFIVNLAGNLHTIYLFTSGYPAENPKPFWEIMDGFNPTKYWYPNATRFIPLTIHEFPSYSYVVADLHGHVFDIPFVLLTITLLFLLIVYKATHHKSHHSKQNHIQTKGVTFVENMRKKLNNISANTMYYGISAISLGFMTAIHYMTNAFDGPIYLLMTGLFLLVMFGVSIQFFAYTAIIIVSFLIFSFPFSFFFTPFVSGIGLNCAPDFLVSLGKVGPFLFEKGNCQPDPLWMLGILWGFFWFNFILFFIVKYIQQKNKTHTSPIHRGIDDFIFVCFIFGTLLVFIPEFFYIKDIYPAHFRANTMFKLGYQAFIIMGIASGYTFFRILFLKKITRFILMFIYLIFFGFVFIYPFFSFPSYYGTLRKTPQLNGITWLETTYPQDKEIIDFLNENVQDQPVILEAQGDSYTDFERISAYTGLPTVAGWWVHEWLWHGSPDVVGNRIPDIVTIYESTDVRKTKEIIEKYDIRYIIVSQMERQKYTNLQEDKFNVIGRKIFTSTNGYGALYQVIHK
ncbi:MAG: DUF2298 domain-containing protein [Patescibacteria group bacterium]